MKRRKWDSRTKAKIVVEGLGGRPVAELCNAWQISWGYMPRPGTVVPSGWHSVYGKVDRNAEGE